MRSAVANNHKWEVFYEAIPSSKKLQTNEKTPAELYKLLKDTTDYAWYTTRCVYLMAICEKKSIQLFLFSLFSHVSYTIFTAASS